MASINARKYFKSKVPQQNFAYLHTCRKCSNRWLADIKQEFCKCGHTDLDQPNSGIICKKVKLDSEGRLVLRLVRVLENGQ